MRFKVNLIDRIQKITNNIFQWRIRIINLSTGKEVNFSQCILVSRADPFIIESNKRIYIFYEEFNIFKRKGYICVSEYDTNKNKLKHKKTIIDESFHVSFPHVILIDKQFYMLPETSEVNKLILYEFLEFPHKISKSRILLSDIKLSDSVYYEYNDFKFILSSMQTIKDRNMTSNLILIPTKDLVNGEIDINAMQILKEDVSESRMAGALFKINNMLFRFSQDCSEYYGHKINIHLLEIDDNRITEKKIITIEPKNNEIGIHTLNVTSRYAVIDYKINVRNLFIKILALVLALKQKFKL